MRSLLRSVEENCGRRRRDLQFTKVAVAEEPRPCPGCGAAMTVQKSVRRFGRTLEHGSFEARETIHACPAGCRQPSGAKVTMRAASLSTALLPRQTVGYDVMVFVGLQRFVHERQREEVREALRAEHGIEISTGKVSTLQRRFVVYLQCLHAARRDAIRQEFERDGGWPLHIDATGEDGRGTLLIAYAGWRRWVLGSWKIPTEHSEAILPCLHRVAEAFGPPVAVVRDLGKAMTPAVRSFVNELGGDIPVLACHQHFLADVGGDLLDKLHARLRDLFRRFRVRPKLRTLARDLGRKLGEGIDQGRDGVEAWTDQSEARHTVPEGNSGLAVVRALAQWVLDYAAEGNDVGLPFDRPYLDFHDRCTEARRAVDAYLRCPPNDCEVHRVLRRLRDILDPVGAEVPFSQVAHKLRWRAGLFDELRDALRLAPKTTGRNEDARASAEHVPPEQAQAELRDIRKAVEALTADLEARRPKRGPAKDQREAIDIIIKHVAKHGPTLWGHVRTRRGPYQQPAGVAQRHHQARRAPPLRPQEANAGPGTPPAWSPSGLQPVRPRLRGHTVRHPGSPPSCLRNPRRRSTQAQAQRPPDQVHPGPLRLTHLRRDSLPTEARPRACPVRRPASPHQGRSQEPSTPNHCPPHPTPSNQRLTP